MTLARKRHPRLTFWIADPLGDDECNVLLVGMSAIFNGQRWGGYQVILVDDILRAGDYGMIDPLVRSWLHELAEAALYGPAKEKQNE